LQSASNIQCSSAFFLSLSCSNLSFTLHRLGCTAAHVSQAGACRIHAPQE